jgi:hypothetical protein
MPLTHIIQLTSEVPTSPEPYAVEHMALQTIAAVCALSKFCLQVEVEVGQVLLLASTM